MLENQREQHIILKKYSVKQREQHIILKKYSVQLWYKSKMVAELIDHLAIYFALMTGAV